MPRSLPLVLLAAVIATAAPDARAQGPTFGGAQGYAEQLRERQALRPLAADPADADSPDAAVQRLEIDGLLVDETMTRIGRDFYDVFFRVWTAPPRAINFTVSVQEQPLPQLGTLVSVRVNDELVYQARLQPQAEQIEGAAYQAAAMAARHLDTRGAPPVY